MRKFAFFLPVLLLLVASCESTEPSETSQQGRSAQAGMWRMTLIIGYDVLPFTAELKTVRGATELVIHNADERVSATLTAQRNDTLVFEMPVYNSTLFLHMESPDLMTGLWENHDRENYQIPVIAEYGRDFRFTPSKSTTQLAPRYKVRFGGEAGYDAVLLLQNDGGRLTGTFLTETGDYRYLEGSIMNGKIHLSTFDGSHAFLFDAVIDGDTLRDGRFLSGTHYTNTWRAVADSQFELGDPTELTQLKTECDRFTFSLVDQDGNQVSETDFQDGTRVVVYDIMGSWCPNCKDAALALARLESKIGAERIKVIPIAFERSEDLNVARTRVFKMQDDLGLERGFVFGGKADKQSVSQSLPCIGRLLSYPTFIIVDKRGKIAATYSGFYGPGTGSYYTSFLEEMEDLLTQLAHR